MDNDLIWLKQRLDHVSEPQIEYFLEKVAIMINNEMPVTQARVAGLVLLCDHMRL